MNNDIAKEMQRKNEIEEKLRQDAWYHDQAKLRQELAAVEARIRDAQMNGAQLH